MGNLLRRNLENKNKYVVKQELLIYKPRILQIRESRLRNLERTK